MVTGFDVIGSYLINSLKVCKFQLDDKLEPPFYSSRAVKNANIGGKEELDLCG